MTPAEIKAAFVGFDKTHPFYQAVVQLLDNAVNDEQTGATLPHLTDGGRHFNAGRLAHALDFRQAFHGTMAQALWEQNRDLMRAEAAAQRKESETG